MARDLGISVIAEGIESMDEATALRDLGIHLFQGYLFARPGLESLPMPASLCLNDSFMEQSSAA
jgi:EAL domain-containing protein (putative c-di-GMP-specific phosphodiesterase class I)